MVKHIAFTVYPVTDMVRARAFYEGDLGLNPLINHEKWVEYDLSGVCFALTKMMEGVTPSASAGGQIAFEVDNVGRMIETLRKKAFRSSSSRCPLPSAAWPWFPIPKETG